MTLALWSWLLTASSLLSLWIAGRWRWGWLVLAGTEPLWAVYGATTGQPGFIVSATAFALVGLRNFARGSDVGGRTVHHPWSRRGRRDHLVG